MAVHEKPKIVTSGLQCYLDAANPKSYPLGYYSNYPPAQTTTYVKATSYYGAGYEPYRTTNPAISLIGPWNCWIAGYGVTTNQRFHIDLGGAKIVNKIYYENIHTDGSTVEAGAKNFTFWGSNDYSSFTATTYAVDSGWTQITGLSQTLFDKHVVANTPDPKYIIITGNSIGYRYYAFKIADNWGWDKVGIRRIELQTYGNTQWLDLTGNGNHGTLAGDSLPTWNSGGWFNFVGGHQLVHGNYNRFNFSNSTPFEFAWNSSFTFIIIFRSNKNDANIYTLFSNADLDRYQSIGLGVDSDEKFYCIITPGTSSAQRNTHITNSGVCDNRYHIGVLSYTTNSMKCYLDNIPLTISLANTISSGNFYDPGVTKPIVGGFWSNSDSLYIFDFTGDIALFKMYNRALSESEITQNYNALKGRFGL